jgi:uncharacterized membrane protein YeaQ/YmgE (transglycosylase-associated protein family)
VKRPPRWGLRTLGCLLLAFVAGFTADAQGYQTVGTLGCFVLGLLGATWCSIQGLRGSSSFWRR